MIPFIILRHGPTDWNEDRRLQGRADRPLSAAGRRAVARWSLPGALHTWRWHTSPLARARLGGAPRGRAA
jgi:broad specificity phosphatase PhoE